eukprot:8112954-Pyramimonas_sp.AAC.1
MTTMMLLLLLLLMMMITTTTMMMMMLIIMLSTQQPSHFRAIPMPLAQTLGVVTGDSRAARVGGAFAADVRARKRADHGLPGDWARGLRGARDGRAAHPRVPRHGGGPRRMCATIEDP